MPDFTQTQRQNLAEKDQAMPNGSYPIRNRADLRRAIQAYGRAKDKAATKRWIMKRARELNATDLLPENWTKPVAVHANVYSDELYHYGILGMKWGIRRTPEQLGHKTASRKKSSKKKSDSPLERELSKNDKNYKLKRNLIAAITGLPAGVATSLATSWTGPLAIPEGVIAGLVSSTMATNMYDAYKVSKIPKDSSDTISDLKKKHGSSVATDQAFMNNASMNQSMDQLNQMMMNESTRQSINESLMSSSLSMSGGTNPFLFGMM